MVWLSALQMWEEATQRLKTRIATSGVLFGTQLSNVPKLLVTPHSTAKVSMSRDAQEMCINFARMIPVISQAVPAVVYMKNPNEI